MFKNYFKTALRSLTRHKSNSLLNVAGLVVGFAAFLLIFLIIQYEKSFDTFHPDKNQIYRVVRIGSNPVNPEYRTGVPFPVTPTLRNELAPLKIAAATYGDNNVQVNVKASDGSTVKKFKEDQVFTAEPQFFKIFNFPLTEGTISSLGEPNSVFLTKQVASKYFGNWKNAMGQTISLYGLDAKVNGILKDPPPNTDFPLGVVLSYATLVKYGNANDWSSISDQNYCFVQLNNNSSTGLVNKLLSVFVDKHIKPVNPGYGLRLQPLKEIHYDARFGNFNGRTFSKDLILALSLIGLFLLIIACVNFINLTTAQALNRSREVGVRKVLGGRRPQLIFQFLCETGITTLIALIFAVIVVVICLPSVDNLLGVRISIKALYTPRFIFPMTASWAAVTLLSGFYPAIVLSSFKPVKVLKAAVTPNSIKGISFRRALVIFQFVIAQALIVGTLVVASQMDYFRSADMGFTKAAVINASFPNDSLSRTKTDLLQNELNKIPGIREVSFSTFAPTAGGGWYTDLRTTDNLTGKQPNMVVCMKPADTGYFRLYDLPLVAGRVYFPSDTTREFVVNETVVKNLGIKNQQTAIGKLINVNGKTCPIVGVVKDFHIYSLRDPIGPVVLTTMKAQYELANIKVNMNQAKNVIASLQKTWNKYYPDYVFEYSFLDQSIADYYKQETQLSALYKIFSAIAIFISCLGLYGLISFMALQRRKEIGIRKVLGAPVWNIVIMLSKEFTILIAIAFLIASPIAWYYMHQWLQQYTYRIAVGIWFFLATVISALLIAWLTVGYTAIKAATANPVNSLRTE